MHRISIPSSVARLFSNVPLESGLPDERIVSATTVKVPSKTFARLRLRPPQSVTAEQLLLIARFTQACGWADAADVIAMVRDPRRSAPHRLSLSMIARSFARATKPCLELMRKVSALATVANRIYLFDRGDSLAYFQPPPEDDEYPAKDEPAAMQQRDRNGWEPNPWGLRYERNPRILAVLTPGSLTTRKDRHGDPPIEKLIDGIDTGEHSLTIVDDSLNRQHRVFRGVFAEAQSVAIFDGRQMFMLPKHGNSIRLYDSADGPEQGRLIADSIVCFHRMRRFRLHVPTTAGVTALLRGYLSYRLPGW